MFSFDKIFSSAVKVTRVFPFVISLSIKILIKFSKDNEIKERIINETLNIDKYNLLQDDLFTYEELKNYKNRKLN